MRLNELGTIIAIIIFGGILLFAPNPDVDGDGKGEVLRVKTTGISVDSVQQ